MRDEEARLGSLNLAFSPAITKQANLSSVLMAKLVSLAEVALLSLALAGCATQPLETERHVKGQPQPNRWKEFLAQAARGEVEEVRDEPAEPPLQRHFS